MEAKISLPPPFCFAKSKYEFHSRVQFEHHHRKNDSANAFLPIIYENNGNFLIPGTFSDTYVKKQKQTHCKTIFHIDSILWAGADVAMLKFYFL